MRSNRERRYEVARRRTIDIGKLLMDALALERELRELYRHHPSDERLRKWKKFRRGVECVVEDYLRGVARYRRATKSAFRPQPARD